MINEKSIKLLEETRKGLHAQAELSGREFNTQQEILNFLEHRCNAKTTKVAGTGVLAEFIGNSHGKSVLIRADIDALPIQEINQFGHRSSMNEISHKCGHDGHTAILLGLALQLSEYPVEKGEIYLLFQPSEENGKGAQMVLNDPCFSKLKFDYVFALHNLPGFPMHEIVVKENEFSSNVKSIIIKLQGKTAHAAEPEKGINPATAIANILQYAAEKTHNFPDSGDFFLVTPVHVTLGSIAYGTSAGAGEVHLTLRSRSIELMEKESDKLEAFVTAVCRSQQLISEIVWLEEFYSSNNDAEAVAFIRNAAKEIQMSVNEISTPFKWGEDFGLFTQRFKGALFGLGAGKDTPALHNPDYDFPDEITATGIKLFFNIIRKTLEL